MCGIAGLWERRMRGGGDGAGTAIARMTETLHHRGPDDCGTWRDDSSGLALGFRRLSIIDRSSAGAQPMVSSCGRFVIVYNGETYNADAMRAELRALGRPFRGHSDTEVILEGMASWGVAATTRRLNGMFAIALWDKNERRLHLIRDRFGIKPLYWAELAGRIMFASELKALRCLDDWPVELDLDSLTAYFRRRYVPGPWSIYRGVSKLPPGTILSVDAESAPRIEPYWSLEEVVRAGHAAPFSGDEKMAIDQLDSLLGSAVKHAMLSDVPLGAYLSGGIDSSVVTALMQVGSSRPIRSFSIGFEEPQYNEAHHAAAVSQHLGTDHTELYISPQHALDLIPRLPEMFDEPLGNVAGIPLHLLSAMARRHVTVALTGEGGDELFAGYSRYFQATDLWRSLTRVPLALRRLARCAIRVSSASAWTGLGSAIPAIFRPPHFGNKLYKLERVLTGEPSDVYRLITSYWEEPTAVVGRHERPDLISNPRLAAILPDFVERMQFVDSSTILCDSILATADRASMAVGLELRPPILDHRVASFSWSLPPAMKIRERTGKWILRQVLDRYVPRELVERPKQGFDVPIGAWLRGPLRDWAEDLLDEKRLLREGLLTPGPIRARWHEHLEERRDHGDALWIVLMFQAWKQRWLPQ
jgi:asparagine synthase (glutamine-hydrolysing)